MAALHLLVVAAMAAIPGEGEAIGGGMSKFGPSG